MEIWPIKAPYCFIKPNRLDKYSRFIKKFIGMCHISDKRKQKFMEFNYRETKCFLSLHKILATRMGLQFTKSLLVKTLFIYW